MSGGDGEERSARHAKARGAAEERGGDVEDGLRWLAGHCRFVTTTLPRGELGVSFAALLLAGIPDACRRRVPDLTGSGPDVFARAVDFGILREAPSPRVMRAVPRLIAERSPLFEARGKRQWTLWIVHALDPGMLAKIRRRTPASQLDVCAPSPGSTRAARPRKRSDLTAEVESLRAVLVSERAALAASRAREEALARELGDKTAALDRVLLDAAALSRADADLHQLRVAHARLDAEHRALVAEVEPLRQQLATMQADKARVDAELDGARAHVQVLEEHIRSQITLEDLRVGFERTLRNLRGL